MVMTAVEATGVEEEVVIVPSADEMDKDTFAKHMTLRHLDSLGGLSELSPEITDYVLQCYRSFHARLHHYRLDLEHEHEPDW